MPQPTFGPEGEDVEDGGDGGDTDEEGVVGRAD